MIIVKSHLPHPVKHYYLHTLQRILFPLKFNQQNNSEYKPHHHQHRRSRYYNYYVNKSMQVPSLRYNTLLTSN